MVIRCDLNESAMHVRQAVLQPLELGSRVELSGACAARELRIWQRQQQAVE